MNDPEKGYAGGFSEDQLAGLFEAMEKSYEDWATGFAPAAICEPNLPAIKEFTEGLLQIRPDVALATCKMIFRLDVRHILDKVQTPCTILQSRDDVAVPLEVAQYMATMLKDASLHVLPTRGHLPHLSSSLIVNSFILQAVASH